MKSLCDTCKKEDCDKNFLEIQDEDSTETKKEVIVESCSEYKK
jgi:hypothetical protein